MTEGTIPRLRQRNFTPGGTVDMMVKDVGYLLDMAGAQEVPVPALIHEVYRAARAQGKGSQAQPILVTLWEEWAGTRVGGPRSTGGSGGVAPDIS